jgi:predicted XRE-type DNA-binding protein
MMKNSISIPDSYFEEEQFIVDNIDEDKIIGVLSVRPAPEQVLKFELCKIISMLIKQKGYNNIEAGEVTGNDANDIGRLMNFQIDRFTIDRLIKILTSLEIKLRSGLIS